MAVAFVIDVAVGRFGSSIQASKQSTNQIASASLSTPVIDYQYVVTKHDTVFQMFLVSRLSTSSSFTRKLFYCSMSTISRALLEKQNAETSNALIEKLGRNPGFLSLAKLEGDLTIQRDQEDAVKLEKGIDFAKSKGVIDPNYVPEPYVELDVLGKTPSIVADEILERITSSGGGNDEGSVIVLCGLSGTGKVSETSI